MKERGLPLKHIIGPQTAHKIHPDSKIEIERLLTEIARQGRASTPKEIDLHHLYVALCQNAWLKLEGLERHWHEARVQAFITADNAIELKTKNVSRLTLEFPLDQQVLSRTANIQATVDGHSLTLQPPVNGQPILAHLEKANGSWRISAELDEAQLRKRPGLQGPIDDAFMDSFVFVGPSSWQRIIQWTNGSKTNSRTRKPSGVSTIVAM